MSSNWTTVELKYQIGILRQVKVKTSNWTTVELK